MSCTPTAGTLPFVSNFSVTLTHHNLGLTRRLAGRINVNLASGGSFSNWRAGYTNVSSGETFAIAWNQTLPAVGSLAGESIFTLETRDVTPAPFNQPPYPAAGDTATNGCAITGVAP